MNLNGQNFISSTHNVVIHFRAPTLISIFSKQHLQDYQRHIAVLKESLCAKEEHYNMLQADVDELRTRLEEKNRLIEKKTQSTLGAVQDRNRMQNELTELKDHMDIKDRKINVLQRKVNCDLICLNFLSTFKNAPKFFPT